MKKRIGLILLLALLAVLWLGPWAQAEDYVDNHLEAYVDGLDYDTTSVNLSVAPGEPLTMKVRATADDMSGITYAWTYNILDVSTQKWVENQEIPEATGDTLALERVSSQSEYFCHVTDTYGNSATVGFYLRVDNQLTAYVDGMEDETRWGEFFVPLGQPFTMKVLISAVDTSGLTYTWRCTEDGSFPQIIEGATGDSYTHENMTGHVRYYCEVRDAYGNQDSAEIDLYVENHLTAYVDGVEEDTSSATFHVSPGAPFTMSVRVSADNMDGITYSWGYYEIDPETGYQGNYQAIESATGSSCTLASMTGDVDYQCQVTDAYGTVKEVTFYLRMDNHFSAYVDGVEEDTTSATFTVSPGGSCTMAVRVHADDPAGMTYAWSYSIYDPDEYTWIDYPVIEEATGNTWTAENISGMTDYYCLVTDAYGNSAEVMFSLRVDNHLEAYVDGVEENVTSYTFYVAPQQPFTMKVRVFAEDTNGITYTWSYREYDPETDSWSLWHTDEGAGSSSYTVESVTGDVDYICRVTDAYESDQQVVFHLRPDNQLEAYVDGLDYDTAYASYTLSPGDLITMKVRVSANNMNGITYKWYVSEYNPETYGWNEYHSIEGVTGDSYTPEYMTADYYCQVQDAYGNEQKVWFYLQMDNHLTAYVYGQDEDTTYYEYAALPGESFTMKVQVSADDRNGITYHWSCSERNPETGEYGDWEELGEVTEDTCVLASMSNPIMYQCIVRDPYGGDAYVFWYVALNNHLKAYVDGQSEGTTDATRFFAPGTPVTMKVGVSADNMNGITYAWSYQEYDPETGWGEWQWIEGNDGDTCTLDGLYSRATCECIVWDNYGMSARVYFHLYPDNQLQANPVGGSEKTVGPHDDLTLTVEASCVTGPVHYQWYRDPGGEEVLLEGETEPELTLMNVISNAVYMCVVTDDYGSYKPVYFIIKVENEFHAEALNGITEFIVPPGTPVVLTVTGSCRDGELHYQWNYNDGPVMVVPIEGATDASYVIQEPQRKWLTCEVRDDYGNYTSIGFHVDVDNHLYVYPVNGSRVYVPLNETVTLQVEAGCDVGGLTYQWYKRMYIGPDGEREITGATEASLTTEPVSGEETYLCIVRDEYGGREQVYFTIYQEAGDRWGDLTWTITNGDTLTISGNGPISDFYAFSQSAWLPFQGQITEVVMEEGVTGIGNYAFDHFSALTSVQIPDSVTRIGEKAFNSCSSLTSLEIPKNVTVILSGAFAGCSQLELTLAEDNHAYWLTDGFLITSDGLTLVEYSKHGNASVTVPSPVQTIGTNAFIGCWWLNSVTVPEGVTNINYQAFEACSGLTTVYLPGSLTRLGDGIFIKCSALTDVYYAGTEAEWAELLSHSGINGELDGVTIHFNEAPVLNNVLVLPADLTEIESEAFLGLDSVDGILIPASVTVIADDAFDPGMNLLFTSPDHPLIPWARQHGYNVIVQTGN